MLRDGAHFTAPANWRNPMTSMSALKTILPHERRGNVSPEALARGELIEFFKQKGVGAFDDASVDEYKRAKATRSKRIANFLGPIDDVTFTRAWFFGTVVVGALSGGLVALLAGGLSWSVLLSALFGGLVAFISGGIISLVIHVGWWSNQGAHWQTVSFRQHNDEGRRIKKSVRKLARMVQEERPDCEVLVERFASDPFLTVRLREMPNVSLRVAVWGEWGYRIPKP
jgi:hypothetical protein